MFNCSSSTLVARNLVYHVDPGQDVVITLKGYSMAGRALTVSIATLPSAGFIYQLSQVYSDYGYDPKKTPTAITTAPTLVTGSNYRVVFSRPFSNSPLDSKVRSLLYSLFRKAVIQTQPTSTDDAQLWYFTAPSKFLGNQWATYGGMLTFTLSASEGDFSSSSNLNTPATTPLVILDCATCNLNAGVRLAWPQTLSPAFTGPAQTFSIPLSETAGWVTDPKNTLLPWTPPSQCVLMEVLSKLSGVSILGDFTRRSETVALDAVVLSHGPGQPLACYGAF
ncbi:hypothetical protein DYB37_000340 [Aphanomyces astaci]|uniref:Laminin IV type A domain-containing protein n=1 Tax=Aphanomyces astaci TaxID=112090 RepID=A0A3R6Y0Q2_APHAT|nr:hypothetical protein DYB35_000925 [Aphanomyces astaci]RHZ29059.1 hypothetical protein DYB37_000340 [Aphanomyces astaci]